MSAVVPDGYECCGRMGFYCYNPDSSPFWTGTLIYACIGVVAAIICAIAFRESRGIAVHSAIIATVCLWIMWAMAWLSQWHPLVYPQYTPEEGDDGLTFNGTYASCS